MTGWTATELDRIGGADELTIAGLRQDGTLRKPVILWVVRVGSDLFVRSGYGQGAAWWRGIHVRNQGCVDAGGMSKDVRFEDADPALNDQVDAAYAAKYHRHGAQYVDTVTTAEARSTTIRIVPRRGSN